MRKEKNGKRKCEDHAPLLLKKKINVWSGILEEVLRAQEKK